MQTADTRLPAPVFEIRCALPGCGWRLLVPFGVPQELAARCLHRLGWIADDESDGFICAQHRREPAGDA